MTSRWARILPVLLALFAGPALAGPAVPDWVAPVAATDAGDPSPDPAFVENGVYNVLIDRQTRLRGGGYDQFVRTVRRVVQRPGLEPAGTIRINFDPAEETLDVLGIWRTRDGVRTRVAGLDLIDIRRESGIENGILDGQMTRFGSIGDVRVGDVIEVAYVTHVAPPILPDGYLDAVRSVPTSGYRHDLTQILVPAGRALTVSGPAAPQVTAEAGGTRYLWRHDDVPLPDFDADLQDARKVVGYTLVATKGDWRSVAAAVEPGFAPAPLPPDLAARLAGLTGPEDRRVTQAFRIVQDEIRYMGVEIGSGGYVPRKPGLVWSRRFGDCKDKALLLVSMLSYLGVPADAVLVHSTDGRYLPDHPPSLYAFDHAIVRVHGSAGDYFLDPTGVLQGGMGAKIATHDFRWGLPLVPGATGLIPIPRAPLTKPDVAVLSRYVFGDAAGPGNAAQLYETTTYRGAQADTQRRDISSDGLEGRAADYLDWYRERFPGIERVGDLTVEDDLDSNTLIIREHYTIPPKGMARHWDRFWVNPYETKGVLPELADGKVEKTTDLPRLYHRHRIEITGQPDLGPADDFTQTSTFFRFSRRGEAIPDGVAVTYELQTRAREITPKQAEAYRLDYEAANNRRDLRYRLSHGHGLGATVVAAGMTLDALSIGAVLLLALGVVLGGATRGYRQARS